MEKITVDFEWYRAYNPLLWNILVVDEDWYDVVIIKRVKISKSTIYESKEDFINNLNKNVINGIKTT